MAPAGPTMHWPTGHVTDTPQGPGWCKMSDCRAQVTWSGQQLRSRNWSNSDSHLRAREVCDHINSLTLYGCFIRVLRLSVESARTTWWLAWHLVEFLRRLCLRRSPSFDICTSCQLRPLLYDRTSRVVTYGRPTGIDV